MAMEQITQLNDEALAAAVELLEAHLLASAPVDEQLMSDIHGDAAPFDHLMRSASGVTRQFVEEACAAEFAPEALDKLCTMLYYPCLAGKEGWPEAPGFEDLAERVRAHCSGTFCLVGDIWDRGARGDDVLGVLAGLPQVDVQWGNHDICWMGAAAGDPVCIAMCLRNNMKYNNIAQFEEGYDINLRPLYGLGAALYADDGTMAPAVKAISSILFKCEGQAVMRHPEWRMDDRLLWGKMDLGAGEIEVYGAKHPLLTCDFPTYDPKNPFALSADEARVMAGLIKDFTTSERLQAQIQWLYDHGSVYKVDGDLLLFHGCVPLDEDGSFAQVACDDGRTRAGRELLDWTEALARRAWETRDQMDLDWMGFLWTGWQSTFAGRLVKTFERAYIEDQSTWKEPEDPYYAITCGDGDVCRAILAEFGVDPERGRIVNGHTPVKLPKGQSPVRAGGKRLVIDGGMCFYYHKATGNAGYTLVRRGDELTLVSHGEFPGEDAVFTAQADVSHTFQTL